MKNKTIILLLLSFLLFANVYAFAEDSETLVIDSVTFSESTDEDVIQVDVAYTATTGVEEVTLFMTVEKGESETRIEDAIYINQVPNTNGTYQFPIAKSKIQEIAEKEDIDGVLLSLKMGGTSVPTPSIKTLAYEGTSGSGEDSAVIGDANGDGDVDFVDALVVLKHDAGLSSLSGKHLTAADANKDGDVDFVDALLILKYDAGLIPNFN